MKKNLRHLDVTSRLPLSMEQKALKDLLQMQWRTLRTRISTPAVPNRCSKPFGARATPRVNSALKKEWVADLARVWDALAKLSRATSAFARKDPL